jgi:uncharacterized protein (TIGR02246 family)
MRTYRFVLVLLLLAFTPGVNAAFADPADEVSAVVDRWATAFNANDVDALVDLYTPDAILVGSTGLARHAGRDAIRGYFARLANSGDKVVIEDRKIVSLGDNIAYATGFYEFSAMREGDLKKSKAGFSMIFVKQGNDWLIAHHHSSVRSSPPPALPVRKI